MTLVLLSVTSKPFLNLLMRHLPLLSRRAFVGVGAAALGSVILSGLPGTAGFARRAWADQAPAASISLALDMSAWNLDADNGVWWQVGVPYCTNPATLDYETLGIYVPQAYMTGAVNNDGQTYTCQLDAAGQA